MKHAFLFLVLAATSACFSQDVTRYFPPDFDESYYSKYLRAMDEPSLFEPKDQKRREVCRFLWIRTFHTPIVVLVEHNGTNATLRFSRFKRVDGLPSKLVGEERLSISKAQWLDLTNSIAKSNFWEMPSKSAKNGTDGSHWILEVAGKGGYKIVDRWSPTEDTELKSYVDLCLSFLRLAKVDSSKEKIY